MAQHIAGLAFDEQGTKSRIFALSYPANRFRTIRATSVVEASGCFTANRATISAICVASSLCAMSAQSVP